MGLSSHQWTGGNVEINSNNTLPPPASHGPGAKASDALRKCFLKAFTSFFVFLRWKLISTYLLAARTTQAPFKVRCRRQLDEFDAFL